MKTKFKTYVDNIILCIRFPFLYPRNRFTGTHWYSYKMQQYIKRLYKDSTKWVGEFGNATDPFRKLVTNKPKYYYAKVLEWIHDYPLQTFHCLPSYTELDALDTGWRKAFGLEICKEIKEALIKDAGYSGLFKYRISQIKEKFGYLRWYDVNGTKGTDEVVEKYEDISSRTCVLCGKPAKWITKGWISPYCDDCVGNRTASPIK